MKVISRNRKALKESISNPIQQLRNLNDDDQSQTARRSDDAANTINITPGAADRGEKGSHLMNVANSDAIERPMRDEDNTLSRTESRRHRLQRGRKAFAKAGKAIVERFSNSLERNTRKALQNSDPLSTSSDGLLMHDVDTANDTASNRMSRRIAEGANLNNPKIRSLTGDGNIPRKPLPVYKGLKSISQNNKPLEHRFSDSRRSYHGSSRHGSSGLDVDIGNRKSRPTSMQEPLLTQDLRDDVYRSMIEVSPLEPEQPSRFSEATSGLAQHPDVSMFSSSPDGTSTPCVRLEPTTTEAKKRLTTVPSSSTSFLEPSSKDDNTTSSGDELASPSLRKAAKSLSLKRKTGKEDLRTGGPRPPKKSKQASITTNEDLALASGIDRLDTKDPSALRCKDTNQQVRGARPDGRTAKGLGIFDTGQTEASQSLPVPGAKKLRRRPSKRSSIPKPIGRISARGRRASSVLTARATDVDGYGPNRNANDGMDVDDLQLDLSEYHLGTKGR